VCPVPTLHYFFFTSCLKLYSICSYRLISPDPLLWAPVCTYRSVLVVSEAVVVVGKEIAAERGIGQPKKEVLVGTARSCCQVAIPGRHVPVHQRPFVQVLQRCQQLQPQHHSLQTRKYFMYRRRTYYVILLGALVGVGPGYLDFF
jgi:hypothetical protein